MFTTSNYLQYLIQNFSPWGPLSHNINIWSKLLIQINFESPLQVCSRKFYLIMFNFFCLSWPLPYVCLSTPTPDQKQLHRPRTSQLWMGLARTLISQHNVLFNSPGCLARTYLWTQSLLMLVWSFVHIRIRPPIFSWLCTHSRLDIATDELGREVDHQGTSPLPLSHA